VPLWFVTTVATTSLTCILWLSSLSPPTFRPTQALKNWFTVSIVLLAFAYVFLGRWDYMLGQADAEPSIDGVKRFPSMYRLPNDSKVGSKPPPEPTPAMAPEDEGRGKVRRGGTLFFLPCHSHSALDFQKGC